MNANEIANQFRHNPVVQDFLKAGKPIQAIKEIREKTNCSLLDAKNALEVIRGTDMYGRPLKMYTETELDDLIVRNAIHRLTLTAWEYDAFKRKGLVD